MMSRSPSELPSVERLQKPLARLLRPLVRLLIRTGVTCPALCDLLRELYINVAEYDFILPGKGQTDSRVSLLTGIHRKEVARLRGAGAPISAVPVAISRTSRVLARWLSSPEFTDADGYPIPLPKTGTISFDALVESVTRDVRPRAILDEWLHRGLALVNGDDCVVLAQAANVPASGTEQQLYYFGRNMHDHLAAAVANVLGEEHRFLERAVHYDNLSEAAARRLEERSRELVMDMLIAANREAAEICETDEGGSWRWNLGTYVFREAALPRPSAPASDER